MQIAAHDVLIVVDIQNDFCPGGQLQQNPSRCTQTHIRQAAFSSRKRHPARFKNAHCYSDPALAVAGGDSVIEPIHRIAPLFDHIILTQDWHPANHTSFAANHPGKRPYDSIQLSYGPQTLWPTHCVQNTQGAEFHPRLHLPQAELILRKGFHAHIDSYSAFFENDRVTPTGLAGYLRERGIERIFLAGLAYDYCVAYSALDARRLSLPVFIVRDCCRAIDLNGSVAMMEAEFDKAGVSIIESADLVAVSSRTI